MTDKTKEPCTCKTTKDGAKNSAAVLRIKWQRLLEDNETCPRCGSTEQELDAAAGILRKMLAEARIGVVVEKESLSVSEFKQDPLRSNMIWINDRPLEEYFGGGTGQNPCCGVCSPFECRTMEIDGKTYESIPSDIIIRAGLVAAAQLFQNMKKDLCCK
jgi:hypothetical protein